MHRSLPGKGRYPPNYSRKHPLCRSGPVSFLCLPHDTPSVTGPQFLSSSKSTAGPLLGGRHTLACLLPPRKCIPQDTNHRNDRRQFHSQSLWESAIAGRMQRNNRPPGRMEKMFGRRTNRDWPGPKFASRAPRVPLPYTELQGTVQATPPRIVPFAKVCGPSPDRAPSSGKDRLHRREHVPRISSPRDGDRAATLADSRFLVTRVPYFYQNRRVNSRAAKFSAATVALLIR